MENHRIKVKLGDAEFDAEGKPEDVKAQYDAFLALLAALPKTQPPAASEKPIGASALTAPPGEVERALLDRVFRQGDVLSLAALPTGEAREADTMLALLYGYLKLADEQTVTGTSLRRSALQSGVNIDRADRVLNGLIPEFVLAGGVRKARRYQLNNRGIARAEAIIKALLQ